MKNLRHGNCFTRHIKKFNMRNIRQNLSIAFAAICFASFCLTSCKKSDPQPKKTAHQKLIGTWNIDYTYLSYSLVGSNSGTLTFKDCQADSCQGSGYNSSDKTTGGFIWKLKNDTLLTFTDTSSGTGGYWNGTYTIATLTDTKLTFKASTFLGEVNNVCSKK